MYNIRRHTIVIVVILIFSFGTMTINAQDLLEWQDRKDRHEGIRGRLKGAQIELLSAAVLYKETSSSIKDTSDTAHLQFYLANDEPVFITVREFSRHDYWMQPHQQPEWKKGWNSFSWPMNEVLHKLEPVPPLHELAAVARIGGKDSDLLAPIVLYQKESPPQITAYRFIFRPPDNGDVVELKWAWYRLDKDLHKLIGESESPQKRHSAGKPFYIDWKCIHKGKALPKGWYQLSVTGQLEYPGHDEELDEVYRLYHQPVLR